MKTSFSKIGLTSVAAMGLVASAGTAFAQTIYVEQVGSGSAALTNAGAALFLDQYSTSFVAGTAVNLTATAPNSIVDSGTATSEGELTQSGNLLTFVGYDAPVGGTNATGGSIASSTYARGVGIYNATTGTIDDSTMLAAATSYSGNNIRSATTTDGTTIYTSGPSTGGGVRSTTDGATTSTSAEATYTNTRYVESYAGNVYFTTGSSPSGIYELNGTTAPTTVVSTGTGASPYGFVFTNGGTVLYVADTNATGTTTSYGIEKFTSSGGVFSTTPAETFDVTGGGFSGIAFGGLDAAGNNILYAVNGTAVSATSTIGGLYSLDDTGSNATLVQDVVAPLNTAFRGVAFIAPVAAPEPSSVAGLVIGAGGLGMLVARRRRAVKAA